MNTLLQVLKYKSQLILKFLFVFCICLFLITYNFNLQAQSTFIVDYTKVKNEIEDEMKKIDQEAEKINVDLENPANLKSTLQEQQKSVQLQINETESVIVSSKLLINKIEAQIVLKQNEYDSLINQMKGMLLEIEKDSRIPIFMRILSSENMIDALTKTYSYGLLESKAGVLRSELDSARKELEENKVKQQARQEKLDQTSFLLKSKKTGLDDLINRYRNKEDEYSALAKVLNEQRRLQEAEAAAVEREKKLNKAVVAASATSCWFEESVSLQIDKTYFGKPAEGAISRFFDGCRHDAVDIANSSGTALWATADGVVQRKGFGSGGYGNFIILKHILPSGQQVFALYAHMNAQSFLKVGDAVSKGSTIGYMGSTGYSTGPHLHFALLSDSYEKNNNEGCRNGGRTHSYCFNPAKYINFGG